MSLISLKDRKALAPVFTTQSGFLFEGDCLDIMKKLDSESVDCFFADPPFNLKKDYGSKVNDNLEHSTYLDWCYKWIDEGVRLLKPGGSFFVYNLPKWNIHLASYLSKKLTFRHWIAVDIKFSLPIQGRLYPSHYSLLYFCKGDRPKSFSPPRIPIDTCRHCGGEIKDYGGYKNKMNPKGVNIADVWTDIPPVRHKKYKTREANELSLKMMDRIIDFATNEGDVVFDPFGGSGTTFVAAELKNRKWIGIELATCKRIIERFENVDSELAYFIELRRRVNVLFSEEALKKREANGRSNEKYRGFEIPPSKEELVHQCPLGFEVLQS